MIEIFMGVLIGLVIGVLFGASQMDRAWERDMVHKNLGTYDSDGEFEFINCAGKGPYLK